MMKTLTRDELQFFSESIIMNDLINLVNQIIRNRKCKLNLDYSRYGDIVFNLSEKWRYGDDPYSFRFWVYRRGKKKSKNDILELVSSSPLDSLNIDDKFEKCHIKQLTIDKDNLIKLQETIRFLIEETQNEYELYLGNLDVFKQSLSIAQELVRR